LMVTFDNGDFDAAGVVYTTLIGPQVTPKTVSGTPYKHQNALRTILDALGITTHPGASATATPMADFFSGSVNISSPAQGATTGTDVLVTATAQEPNTPISQVQVWDNTTGQKLGIAWGSSINQTFTLVPGPHQLDVVDMSDTFQVLHKSSVNINVTSGGVTISSPGQGATTGTQVRVKATALEADTQISQLQVWDNTTGQRLGIAWGASIDQTFNLSTGRHQLVVEDLSAGSFQVLHKSTVDITVAGGVTISSPSDGATNGTQVQVNASAAEGSTPISQLQVWDNTTGQRLGIAWGSSINQSFTLAPGPHELVVVDLGATFQVLHKSSVNINVVAGQ
jgi:hypothetical protein